LLDEVDDLALSDAANLIQMKAALAFLGFRVHGRAEKGVNNHGNGGKGRATHGQHEFPIGKQSFQRVNSTS
jgi:hypothetical protein